MLGSLVRAMFRAAAGRGEDGRAPDSPDGGSRDAERLTRAAIARHAEGDIVGAQELASRALLLDHGSAQARTLLGAIALERDEFELACTNFDAVLLLHPEHADYLANAGEAKRRAGDWESALTLANRALAIDPAHGLACHVSAYALDALGRGREAYTYFRRILQADPGNVKIHSGLLSLLQRCPILSPSKVFAEHREWGMRHANSYAPLDHAYENPKDPERKLRIGYVSADFVRHPVGELMEPVLRHHDRDRFEIHAYFNSAESDPLTATLRRMSDGWRNITAMTDKDAAQVVREDGIDLLFDLSGHTRSNRLLLFAHKPAPVQISYLGYLGTTGVCTVDYRITDIHSDPPGESDALHTEQLLRMPYAQWCYQPPSGAREPGAAPMNERGYTTFGSFNNFMKVQPETARVWGDILERIPRSRLRVAVIPQPESADWLVRDFERRGIALERIELLGRLTFDRYLEEIRCVDIALDTFPLAGAATTFDASWMGVPTVTLAGRYGGARAGTSILRTLGLDELVAEDHIQYSNIAVELARNPARIEAYRASLRAAMLSAPFMQPARFTHDLELLYRLAWRNYCRA